MSSIKPSRKVANAAKPPVAAKQPTENKWNKVSRLFGRLSALFLAVSLAILLEILVSNLLGPPSETTNVIENTGGPQLWKDELNLRLPTIPMFALLVSLGAFFVTGVGTASAVILGWRGDSRDAAKAKREAAESQLRIEQLELQLAEARRKNGRRPNST